MPKHLRRSRLGLTQDQGQIWRLCAQSVQMRSDCSIAHVCSMQAYAHTHTHTHRSANEHWWASHETINDRNECYPKCILLNAPYRMPLNKQLLMFVVEACVCCVLCVCVCVCVVWCVLCDVCCVCVCVCVICVCVICVCVCVCRVCVSCVCVCVCARADAPWSACFYDTSVKYNPSSKHFHFKMYSSRTWIWKCALTFNDLTAFEVLIKILKAMLTALSLVLIRICVLMFHVFFPHLSLLENALENFVFSCKKYCNYYYMHEHWNIVFSCKSFASACI